MLNDIGYPNFLKRLQYNGSFYPRYAMLVRYYLWLCVHVCVCLSVTIQCFVETDGRIEPALAQRLLLPVPRCVVSKFGYLEK